MTGPDPLGAAEASHADIPELAVMSDEHGPFCCSGHWLHLQQRGRPHHGAWFAAAEGFDQRRAILAELQNGLPRAETVLFEDSGTHAIPRTTERLSRVGAHLSWQD